MVVTLSKYWGFDTLATNCLQIQTQGTGPTSVPTWIQLLHEVGCGGLWP